MFDVGSVTDVFRVKKAMNDILNVGTGFFVYIFDNLAAKFGGFGDLFHQRFVVELKFELFSDKLGDGFATGSRIAGDSDEGFFGNQRMRVGKGVSS